MPLAAVLGARQIYHDRFKFGKVSVHLMWRAFCYWLSHCVMRGRITYMLYSFKPRGIGGSLHIGTKGLPIPALES